MLPRLKHITNEKNLSHQSFQFSEFLLFVSDVYLLHSQTVTTFTLVVKHYKYYTLAIKIKYGMVIALY